MRMERKDEQKEDWTECDSWGHKVATGCFCIVVQNVDDHDPRVGTIVSIATKKQRLR